MRNAGDLGKYNGPGLPDATGMFRRIVMFDKTMTATGVFSETTSTAEGSSNMGSSGEMVAALQFALSSVNGIFGAASTVMPASTDVAIALYLGSTA